MIDTVELPGVVTTAFREQFDGSPSHIGRAPGRINIIGEHTDYNDGFVLPAAIEQSIFITGRIRSDNRITVQSLDYGGIASFTINQLRDKNLPHFTRYPRGVLWVLSEKGHLLRGMDLTIAGNVPSGGGFSSSAALAVALFEITTALLDIKIAQKDKALFSVEVENQFIGARTGIMDQMISALGQEDRALLIDCRSTETTPVPLPPGVKFVTADTMKRHDHTTSGYSTRREECEEAARLLGVKALRDVTPEQLAAQIDKLPEVIAKRAQHVVDEDVRTLNAVSALNDGDLAVVGRLLNESHASLRDLFQISIKELDIMADLAQSQPGCFGARMMGGGFGGAVIALVEDAYIDSFADAVAKGYEAATRIQPAIHVVRAGAGSSIAAL